MLQILSQCDHIVIIDVIYAGYLALAVANDNKAVGFIHFGFASNLVGDRASDISAGQAVGCRSVFIDRRYSESPPHAPDASVRSLTAAVDFIINQITTL